MNSELGDKKPEVSVIVPTFNRVGLIGETLKSVRAQGLKIQLIVVDDGSTDGTRQALQGELDILLVCQANLGPSAARNAGLELATAPLLAFLDSRAAAEANAARYAGKK